MDITVTPAEADSSLAHSSSDGRAIDAVVELKGRFDAFECEAFRTEVDAMLAQGASRMWLDLSDVVFIDSSALAELVRTMKRTREADGELLVANPSDPVRVIFELTRLDRAFAIVV